MIKNNLKIFFFVDYWPLPIGGMEIHAIEFIKNFKNKNLNIIGFSEKENNIKKNKNIDILPKESIYKKNYVINLLKSKNIKDADVLFFNSMYWVEIFKELKNNFPNCIFIMRSGGNDIMQSEVLRQGKTLKERRSYVIDTINNTIDVLIINSNYVYKKFLHLGIKKNKMQILTGGVDTKVFKPLKNSKEKKKLKKELGFLINGINLLCVCRLVPFKGLEFLIKAISLLKVDTIFKLIIIGNGSLKNKIQKLIYDLKMENKIILHNEVKHNKIFKFFQAADIYVQTPIYCINTVLGGQYIHTETMGRTFCEAIASNLPIIATSVGGVADIVGKNKCGILVRQKDIKQTTKALKDMINSKKLRKNIIENQKKYKHNYEWIHIFNSYNNIFNNKK